MRWVTTHARELHFYEKSADSEQSLASGFTDSISKRAVHELLFNPAPGAMLPLLPALIAACAGAASADPLGSPGKLIWIDATDSFYPPAAIAMGIAPQQLRLIRPKPADILWATAECLRCPGVGAVVSTITQPMTRVQARRLQLAAEQGGGAGILLRPNLRSARADIYAAATRWLVSPTPGERTIQRWRLQLLHGHGRQIGQTFILEKHRGSTETNLVHLSAPLVDHAKVQEAS